MNKLMRLCVAIATVFGIGLSTAVVTAQPASAAPVFCSTPLEFFVDGRVNDWSSIREILSHHFGVRTKVDGVPDMTGEVRSGTAYISWNGQEVKVDAWSVNTWGVPTTWIKDHVFSGNLFNGWTLHWLRRPDGFLC